VTGDDYDAAVEAAEAEGRERGWYTRTCALNPLLVEGKKTAAFEIAEALGWAAPDVVVTPVGDGCTLAAIGKGFSELARLGRTQRLPRLVGVQSRGVQPLVRRFRGEPPAEPEPSRAFSIAVRRPRNALRLLAEIAASGGTLLAVPDDAMARAADALAREAGIVAELTSAAALAGLLELAESESLAGRVAVVVVTGGRPDTDA
jgi:threonine synthase